MRNSFSGTDLGRILIRPDVGQILIGKLHKRPPAGLRPAGGPIWTFSRLEYGRSPLRSDPESLLRNFGYEKQTIWGSKEGSGRRNLVQTQSTPQGSLVSDGGREKPCADPCGCYPMFIRERSGPLGPIRDPAPTWRQIAFGEPLKVPFRCARNLSVGTLLAESGARRLATATVAVHE